MKCHLVLFLVCWVFKLVQSHEGKHVHVKIVVPVYKHNHHHTHKVYKHLPPPPPQVVVHHHHHDHKHGHDHGHDHKHDHHHHKDHGEHGHWDVHDWSEHSSFSSSGGGDSDLHSQNIPESFRPEPTVTEKTESHKTLKVEQFQLSEAKDSSAFNPVQQHYVTGSYTVQEGDGTRSKVHKLFQAPLANINLRQTGYGESEDEDLDEYEEPKQPNPYELEPLRQFFQNQNQI